MAPRPFMELLAPSALARTTLLRSRPPTRLACLRHFTSSGAGPTRATYRRFGDVYQQGRLGGGPSSSFPGSNALRQRVRNVPNIVWVVAGGSGVYYVYHIETTETGRWRFMDTSEETERRMGEEATKEILQQYAGRILPDSHPTARYVRKVADRILQASGLDTSTYGGNNAMKELGDRWGSVDRKKGVNWKVRVIKDDATKNAFVLPNGAIFVFTGILPICGNEDGLAAVLGHEISHQVARHAAERISGQKVSVALSLLASTLGIDPNLTSPALGLLLTLPNSRAAETEADHIGLKLASKACYDPSEAVNLWIRMQQSEGGGSGGPGVDFLSTHPANAKRIEQIKSWLPEAYEIRNQSCGAGMAQSVSSFSSKTGSFWR